MPQGGTLHYLSRRATESFETANAQMVPTSRLRWVHRGLTSWRTLPDKDTILVPDLATDTGTTDDGGKTWTFTLQEGLKFSDGSPITARTSSTASSGRSPRVPGGLGYHKTLLVGGTRYKGPYDGKELDSIEIVDDHKIVFHLDASVRRLAVDRRPCRLRAGAEPRPTSRRPTASTRSPAARTR